MSASERWRTQRLGEVVALQRGFDLPHHARRPGPYPVLTAGESDDFHEEGPVRGPGVVIGRATNLGKPKWSDVDFWPHNTTMFVSNFFGNEPRWVFHLFESMDLAAHNSGSVQPMLNRNYIAHIPVAVPGIAEQRAITEVLGALDDKIAANTKALDVITQLAELHFRRTRSAEGTTMRLADVVSTQYGITTSTTQESGPKLVRVTDINKKDWIEWSSSPSCVASAAELERYGTRPGDILVARMADPGKVGFVDTGAPRAVFASYLVRLVPNDRTISLYLYYFLRSPEYRRYAEGAMQGSVQKNMNARIIVATDVWIPSEPILESFNSSVVPLRDALSARIAENRKLTETRDTLLPQLMSGKLRVRDAERTVNEVL